MERHHVLTGVIPIAAALCLCIPFAACDSRGVAQPTSLPSPAPTSLSGQVFEVIPGGRVPATNFPLLVDVITTSGCSAPCSITNTFTRVNATTGDDGRYHVSNLPPGQAIILPATVSHRLACGAAATLAAATRLDVEVTSAANPQLSPTRPPIRVNGQVYEITPAGRAGLDGVEIFVAWRYPDNPFATFFTDKDGGYAACGIPPNTLMYFEVFRNGYEAGPGVWQHSFSADTTLDIELRRQ